MDEQGMVDANVLPVTLFLPCLETRTVLCTVVITSWETPNPLGCEMAIWQYRKLNCETHLLIHFYPYSLVVGYLWAIVSSHLKSTPLERNWLNIAKCSSYSKIILDILAILDK